MAAKSIPHDLLLDSLKDPFVFVDNGHVIRYMNRRAIEDQGEELIGTSIFDCHGDSSSETIRRIHSKMLDGLEEELITDDVKHRIYMRAVRDGRGALLGYYERYEPPVK